MVWWPCLMEPRHTSMNTIYWLPLGPRLSWHRGKANHWMIFFIADIFMCISTLQVQHNNMIQEIEHQTVGNIRVPGGFEDFGKIFVRFISCGFMIYFSFSSRTGCEVQRRFSFATELPSVSWPAHAGGFRETIEIWQQDHWWTCKQRSHSDLT